MINEETKLVSFKETHRYCDECNTEIRKGLACSKAVCEICGKDLCDRCVGHEADSWGDYRTVYCKKCWEIGESYRIQIKTLEKQIDDLNDEWRSKCKKV